MVINRFNKVKGESAKIFPFHCVVGSHGESGTPRNGCCNAGTGPPGYGVSKGNILCRTFERSSNGSMVRFYERDLTEQCVPSIESCDEISVPESEEALFIEAPGFLVESL